MDSSERSQQNPPTRRGVHVELVVQDADKFDDFFCKATGARQYFRIKDDAGKVMHEALDVESVTMLVEELGNSMYQGEQMPHVRLHLNTDDPMALAEKLEKAGATTLNKCEKQFWGAQWGVYRDPYGVIWGISNSTNALEDVPKELERKIIPFLMVKDASNYLKFLSEVFGAETAMPAAKDPDGNIMCAEMKVNGGLVMIGDECKSDADGDTANTVTIAYEVPTGRAIPTSKAFEANGGKIEQLPGKQFWGQVWGRCLDPFGQAWGICEPVVGEVPTNEEMAMDLRIGHKYDWKYIWVEEDVPAMHCFGEVRQCPAKHDSIASAMEEMLPKAFAAAAEKGLPLVGPVVSAYYVWKDGETRCTFGPTVGSDSPQAEGDGLGVRTLAGCKCVTVVHVGPYSELEKAYNATFEWIAAKGFENRMPCFEIYENNPEDTEPSKLRTKVCVPVVPKAAS